VQTSSYGGLYGNISETIFNKMSWPYKQRAPEPVHQQHMTTNHGDIAQDPKQEYHLHKHEKPTPTSSSYLLIPINFYNSVILIKTTL